MIQKCNVFFIILLLSVPVCSQQFDSDVQIFLEGKFEQMKNFPSFYARLHGTIITHKIMENQQEAREYAQSLLGRDDRAQEDNLSDTVESRVIRNNVHNFTHDRVKIIGACYWFKDSTHFKRIWCKDDEGCRCNLKYGDYLFSQPANSKEIYLKKLDSFYDIIELFKHFSYLNMLYKDKEFARLSFIDDTIKISYTNKEANCILVYDSHSSFFPANLMVEKRDYKCNIQYLNNKKYNNYSVPLTIIIKHFHEHPVYNKMYCSSTHTYEVAVFEFVDIVDENVLDFQVGNGFSLNDLITNDPQKKIIPIRLDEDNPFMGFMEWFEDNYELSSME